ncbi:hypothetical protein [Amycolatopsis sp. lyj-23]|uniref:hypothetical protein n=1 Tax=Amycolatopsis sp. lyj-23 TaxID=2789283 RepID=UPI00397BA21B
MRVAGTVLRGQHCGQVWSQASDLLLAERDRKLLHLIVEIAEPGVEDPAFRAIVDELLARRGYDPVQTVVNTVFPAALAASSSTPERLAQRYRSMYDRIKAERKINRFGTYFGRLVAHPTQKGPVDQLNRIINRLRMYGHNGNHVATAYEGAIDVPEPRTEESEVPGTSDGLSSEEATDDLGACIFNAYTDSMPLGFPCLSHVSFQHTGNRLNAVALYRSQYMVQRGYGNYLALGMLLRYIAEAAGFLPGTLTVITGQAEAEGAAGDLRAALASTTQLPLFSPSAAATTVSRGRRPSPRPPNASGQLSLEADSS